MTVEPKNNTLNLENVFGSRGRLKILINLAKNVELSISELVKRTGLNHSAVLKHIELLKKIKFVQEKNFGRIKILRFNIENVKAKSFKLFVEVWEDNYI